MIRLFNDIDDIYSNGIQKLGGEYNCSVCGKSYKRRENAERHILQQNCHTYKNLFKGLPVEEYLYDIYRILSSIEEKKGYNKAKFIKSQYYTHIAKFYVFCFNSNIRDITGYLEYVLGNTQWSNVYIGLNNGRRKSVLQKYIKDKPKNINRDDSEKFYQQYEIPLRSNTTFALRSLEKGDISLDCLFSHIEKDNFISELNEVEIHRFTSFLLAMEGNV